jgi:DNA-directed RNA polymerase specialized sigma24 family protein
VRKKFLASDLKKDREMGHLSAQEYDILHRRHVNNEKFSDIAKATGLDEKKVRSILTRASHGVRKRHTQRTTTTSMQAMAGDTGGTYDVADTHDQEKESRRGQVHELLNAALKDKRLSPEEHQVLSDHFLGGEPIGELAKKYGVKRQALSVRLDNAMKKAHKILGGLREAMEEWAWEMQIDETLEFISLLEDIADEMDLSDDEVAILEAAMEDEQ